MWVGGREGGSCADSSSLPMNFLKEKPHPRSPLLLQIIPFLLVVNGRALYQRIQWNLYNPTICGSKIASDYRGCWITEVVGLQRLLDYGVTLSVLYFNTHGDSTSQEGWI